MDSDLDLVPGYNPHLKLETLLCITFASGGFGAQLRLVQEALLKDMIKDGLLTHRWGPRLASSES